MTLPTNAAFLGDSITNHLSTLSTWFGAAASAWVNAGVSGDRTDQMLARVGTDVPNGSRYCVILAGVNDILQGAGTGGTFRDITGPGTAANGFQSIANYITQIIANLVGRGITPVLSTVLPIANGFSTVYSGGTITAAQANARIQTLNAWIKTYAANNGYAVADQYAQFVGADTYGINTLYGDDLLHPNAFGNGVLSAVAGAALNGGATVWTFDGVVRDFPVTSGETVSTYRGLINGVALPRNVTLRVGSAGYTGTGMTDTQLDACARAQAGI